MPGRSKAVSRVPHTDTHTENRMEQRNRSHDRILPSRYDNQPKGIADYWFGDGVPVTGVLLYKGARLSNFLGSGTPCS
jgi:hypothetical protein